jgi:hypothetical protein
LCFELNQLDKSFGSIEIVKPENTTSNPNALLSFYIELQRVKRAHAQCLRPTHYPSTICDCANNTNSAHPNFEEESKQLNQALKQKINLKQVRQRLSLPTPSLTIYNCVINANSTCRTFFIASLAR